MTPTIVLPLMIGGLYAAGVYLLLDRSLTRVLLGVLVRHEHMPASRWAGFAVVWGISANTRGWWDLGAARALGYEPADDAEAYAAALVAVHGEPDLADPVHGRVGGEYTTADFDAEHFEENA